MNITIEAIGKKHIPYLKSAIEDYSDRLRHYTALDWQLVEARTSNTMNQDQIKSMESELLLSTISPQDTVILLDERGQEVDSVQLANKIQHYRNRAVKNLVVVIGGAYGVSRPLEQRADFIWSLSKLVFPHQLVRLMVAEQLYRAHTILADENYHHQ